MSKANDTAAVIEKIGKCSESLIIISEQVSLITKTLAEILAELEKSRAGFTAEVKQLLLKHGAEKLSEIAPEKYAALVADVEVLGNE